VVLFRVEGVEVIDSALGASSVILDDELVWLVGPILGLEDQRAAGLNRLPRSGGFGLNDRPTDEVVTLLLAMGRAQDQELNSDEHEQQRASVHAYIHTGILLQDGFQQASLELCSALLSVNLTRVSYAAA
jgi:hypothetical protein